MQTFCIHDMDGFIGHIRNGAAQSISENYTDNLDDFITLSQVKNLVIDHSMGIDENGYHLITENIFDDIFENIRHSIYQSGLSKLAAQNLIECAWDDETNEMVFWTKQS